MTAHQIAARAASGAVSVVGFRDPADGSKSFGAAYTAARGLTTRWISPMRFAEQAHKPFQHRYAELKMLSSS